MRNFLTPKSHGIPRNSAEFFEFRNTEFRVIPRNLGQFRILYGIYGIKKNIRNSVEAEFRKHPIPDSAMSYMETDYRPRAPSSREGRIFLAAVLLASLCGCTWRWSTAGRCAPCTWCMPSSCPPSTGWSPLASLPSGTSECVFWTTCMPYGQTSSVGFACVNMPIFQIQKYYSFYFIYQIQI